MMIILKIDNGLIYVGYVSLFRDMTCAELSNLWRLIGFVSAKNLQELNTEAVCFDFMVGTVDGDLVLLPIDSWNDAEDFLDCSGEIRIQQDGTVKVSLNDD